MEAMNDGLTYALVFGIVFLGGLLIVLLVRLVFDIRERIKQKDLDDLRLKCKERQSFFFRFSFLFFKAHIKRMWAFNNIAPGCKSLAYYILRSLQKFI